MFNKKLKQELLDLKAKLAEPTEPTEEEKIKKQIMDRAIKMAEDAYAKEVMFKDLNSSNMNYAIMEDLMRAAQLTGEVEIKFKDGAIVTIKSKSESARQTLNREDLF